MPEHSGAAARLAKSAIAFLIGAREARSRPGEPAPCVVAVAGTPEDNVDIVAAFRKGKSEAGFVEGRNVAVECAAFGTLARNADRCDMTRMQDAPVVFENRMAGSFRERPAIRMAARGAV
jgi:hypothetical protein